VLETFGKGWKSAALAALFTFALPAAALAFDPELEVKNFAKIGERFAHITATPEFQARLLQANIDNNVETALIQATDPQRLFVNICGTRTNECAGDVRFYDWTDTGAGIRTPVLFTARSGATLSGNVWATEEGPAKRPAIVITTGSVQAPETLYWGTAATLAKHGYVVLTYDVQGQSRSDVLGEAPDAQEGVPSQAGQPFYDGTEDALDFLLSKPGSPYVPRMSCGNANGGVGTSHAPKQAARVTAGFNSGFNPLHDLVDPNRIGIAGHSLGAAAVSYVGQLDPRVDAIVAYDNLRAPSGAPDCPSTPTSRPESPAITKPAVGISNDYGIAQTPFTSDPDPQSHNAGFLDYQTAGIDSMQVNIRGGTHEESAFIPGNTTGPTPLGAASLRGTDMIAWYSTAWFDKYVKCPGAANPTACEEEADARLLSDRWRDDAPGGAVDLNDDSNLYSFYLRSRFDVTDAAGAAQVCDDMRTGCQSMAPDGGEVPYSFVGDAYDLEGGGEPVDQDCLLPQQGTDGRDTPNTLPPTDAGDAIRGGKGGDRLRGGKGDDCLYGQKGRDRLKGDDGNDVVSGGGGRDRVKGGLGADVLKCGQGRKDVAKADADDTVAANCEIVKGL
jgi:dienelactone hydrolase